MTPSVPLSNLIERADLNRAGRRHYPILSMTMHGGLVEQAQKFKKRVASSDTAQYKVVSRNQLVVGFPIDEGVLSFQRCFDEAIVSPAYNVWKLRSDIEVEPLYLERFLRSPQSLRTFKTKLRGTTARRRTLPEDIFLSIQVPLPPLSEQRRIAAILAKADELRAKRRAALEQLSGLTQAVFLETFGNPVSNPKGWPKQTLASVCEKITDGEHLNPPFSADGMPIVMAGEVLDDEVNVGESKRVEMSLGERFRRKCNPERGDVLLVSRGATIGRSCVVNTDMTFCLMGSVILIKPDRNTIDSQYLSTFLKHPLSTHGLQQASGSSAQRAIYIKDVGNLPVLVPPISLQRKMSVGLAAIAEVKTRCQLSLDAIETLFAALQERAFSGAL